MTTLDENFLALGSCVAGIGILLAGLLALLFRHPGAPRWTRPEIVAMLLCVPVTASIGFGLAYAAYGLSRLVDGAGDPRELLVLAAVLIVLALVWRGLRIRQRLKGYAASHVAPGTST
jgi:heme A synthase